MAQSSHGIYPCQNAGGNNNNASTPLVIDESNTNDNTMQ